MFLKSLYLNMSDAFDVTFGSMLRPSYNQLLLLDLKNAMLLILFQLMLFAWLCIDWVDDVELACWSFNIGWRNCAI